MRLTDKEWDAVLSATALADVVWQDEVDDPYEEFSKAAASRMRALDRAFNKIRREARR